MLEEFCRYCALQRDQAPLALLLIYLKRKGGFVQLNVLWKDLGPSSGGPFWNQTTLLNKLDKLERLEVICLERRVLPSSRLEDKKKTNTFYRINPGSPLTPHIFSMLQIRKDEGEKFSSELVEKPLDHLNEIASRSSKGDHSTKRELEVALELISEVFGIEGDDAQEMIRQRMVARGLIKVAEPEDADTQAGLEGAKEESVNKGADGEGARSAKTEKSKKGGKSGTRKRSRKAKKETVDSQA
jgi:hypothetical protein